MTCKREAYRRCNEVLELHGTSPAPAKTDLPDLCFLLPYLRLCVALIGLPQLHAQTGVKRLLTYSLFWSQLQTT